MITFRELNATFFNKITNIPRLIDTIIPIGSKNPQNNEGVEANT